MGDDKKGVHIMVKLPSGTEVHEFILPMGYTIDQVKSAIFKRIPELGDQSRENFQLAMKDETKARDEVLSVEFNKLSNLKIVQDAQDHQKPLEVSLHSKSPVIKANSPAQSSGSGVSFRRTGSDASLPRVSKNPASSSGNNSSRRVVEHPSRSPAVTSPPTPSKPLPPTPTSSSPTPSSPSPAATTISSPTPSSTSNGTGGGSTRAPSTTTSGSSFVRPSNSTLNSVSTLPSRATVSARFTTEETMKKKLEMTEQELARLKMILDKVSVLAKSGLSSSNWSLGSTHAANAVAGAVAQGNSGPTDAEKRLTKTLDDIVNLIHNGGDKSPRDSSLRTRSFTDVKANLQGTGSPSLPPKKQLTPQERISMLQTEFLQTEEAYVKYLQLVHDLFQVPLETSGLMTPEQIDTLFSKVRTQLLEIHTGLLKALQARKPHQSFSDCLHTFVPYLKLYTDYVNNHQHVTEMLQEFETNSNMKKISAYIKNIENNPACEAQDLASFLIKPIQRLPRYELLLRDMVKYCTDQQEHLKLSRLLETVRKVNEHINESKRKKDNSSKVFEIQNLLLLGSKYKGFVLYEQSRKYVRDDVLMVRKLKSSDKMKKHNILLFNDVMIDTVKTKEGKYKVRQIYKLLEISLQKYEGEADTVALFVTKEGEEDDAVHVKAVPGTDIDPWMQDVLQCIAALKGEGGAVPDRLGPLPANVTSSPN